jgi:hypothetical protein
MPTHSICPGANDVRCTQIWILITEAHLACLPSGVSLREHAEQALLQEQQQAHAANSGSSSAAGGAPAAGAVPTTSSGHPVVSIGTVIPAAQGASGAVEAGSRRRSVLLQPAGQQHSGPLRSARQHARLRSLPANATTEAAGAPTRLSFHIAPFSCRACTK